MEDFLKVWGNAELRQYIKDEAKKRSRRKEVQEEYIQEAWLCIGCAPPHWSIDLYKQLATKMIYSAYWQEYKEYILLKNQI